MYFSKTIAAFSATASLISSASLLGQPIVAGSDGSDLVPMTVTNNSGRQEDVFIYNLGTEISTGRQGWADVDGAFHPWPEGGDTPSPVPDASIAGPPLGQSKKIKLPNFSGRLYFSYGQKLIFSITKDGLVQPAVQNPHDPNRNILFNWSEYTSNRSGVWLNSTQVDMFSAPFSVGMVKSDGSEVATGTLKPGGYKAFFESLEKTPGGWAGLVQRDKGTALRALAPSHGIEAGVFPSNTMNDYIDRVWKKYESEKLTIIPFKDDPQNRFTGTIVENRLEFTDKIGELVTSFDKPDSDSVFGCYKNLDAPDDLVRGPISRTLCAGFNRSTLLTNTQEPSPDFQLFYQDTPTNTYAREVHQQMVDGKAYGFAFDDVSHQESLITDPSPRQTSMTLQPLS